MDPKKTTLINLKDFRQNLTKYADLLENKQSRLIILRRGTPIMEIKSVDKNTDLRELIMEKQPLHLYTLSEAIEILDIKDT